MAEKMFPWYFCPENIWKTKGSGILKTVFNLCTATSASIFFIYSIEIPTVICSLGFAHYNPLQLFDVTRRRSAKTTLRLYDAITVSRILISNDGVPDDNWDSSNTHMCLSQSQTDKVIVLDMASLQVYQNYIIFPPGGRIRADMSTTEYSHDTPPFRGSIRLCHTTQF